MTKAIIFDMDGTMVDNMMIHHRACAPSMGADSAVQVRYTLGSEEY